MKINDSNVHINFEAYAQKSKDASGVQEHTASTTGETHPVDKVVLSPKAREIQEARKLLDEIPDVDEPKVAQIRLRFETGVYTIDGSQIAERMLRDMSLNDNFN